MKVIPRNTIPGHAEMDWWPLDKEALMREYRGCGLRRDCTNPNCRRIYHEDTSDAGNYTLYCSQGCERAAYS